MKANKQIVGAIAIIAAVSHCVALCRAGEEG